MILQGTFLRGRDRVCSPSPVGVEVLCPQRDVLIRLGSQGHTLQGSAGGERASGNQQQPRPHRGQVAPQIS